MGLVLLLLHLSALCSALCLYVPAQPAVSAGNVGQLAVDLLIATCGLVSAGHLRDPTNLLPCVGNNPYADGSAECSTEMQLYSGSDNGMLILQQRAPPMLGRQEQAAQTLAAFLRQQGVEKIVVLGSYSNALPGQESPSGLAPPRYRVSDETAFSSMPYVEWQQLEEIDPLTDKAYTHLVLPPWPFWRACEAAGLPVMLLMLAVSEGDNRGDAMRLASYALEALGAIQGVAERPVDPPTRWVVPPSWIVFGRQSAVY